MPWKECSAMSLRREFVTVALLHDRTFQALCSSYGISTKTGYKWLARYHEQGEAGLEELSRRPHSSPNQTPEALEDTILSLRDQYPAWGGRKLRQLLLNRGQPPVPAASTITEILRRHGLLSPEESAKRQAWHRFEHDAPNSLWQMDFKGDFPVEAGGRCYPLTVLDDHSRFSLCLQACGDQKAETVQPTLGEVFRRYGLPEAMIMDNGPPWGHEGPFYTRFAAWLIRLGITVSHSRPHHPQTLGKDERFHRTLKHEVLIRQSFRDLDHCQHRFDHWRALYNRVRPHESLKLQTPATRYRSSSRSFPEQLGPIEYAPGALVRKVQHNGEISYRNRYFMVGRAFHGHPVALRDTDVDGVMDIYFCHQRISLLDLRTP
jgi:transposase InsO family protein